jgi:hypothetical protein
MVQKEKTDPVPGIKITFNHAYLKLNYQGFLPINLFQLVCIIHGFVIQKRIYILLLINSSYF